MGFPGSSASESVTIGFKPVERESKHVIVHSPVMIIYKMLKLVLDQSDNECDFEMVFLVFFY